MGILTNFLKLLKPEPNDFYNQQTEQAENWDKVDKFAKDVNDNKVSKAGDTMSGVLEIETATPCTYFKDTRVGSSLAGGYVGFGSSAVQRFQFVNVFSDGSKRELSIRENKKLVYDGNEVRDALNNSRTSLFFNRDSGSTSGDYSGGYNIPLFKDSSTNDLNMVYSSADNSIKVTEAGRYVIFLKSYVNIATSANIDSPVAVCRLHRNVNTLMYLEFTNNRNSVTNAIVTDLAVDDKIFFNCTRRDVSRSISFENGDVCNRLTFIKLN